MALESLPNEIFLDLFDFLSGIELLRTFYGLNARLDSLLHDKFPTCSFQFDFLSKRDFDRICQHHLPRIDGYMRNICLSEHDDTPRQCDLFLAYVPSFYRFSHLQSLTLSHVRSYQTLSKFINECRSLPNLTQLNLSSCYLQDYHIDLQSMIDCIWSFSNLTHCNIGIGIKGQSLFCVPTTISSSLESVAIERMQVQLNQVSQLYECTPGLKYLSISVPSFVDNDYVPSTLSTLIDLNIRSFFTCDAARIGTFLQNTPNLSRLSVELSSELVNGNQWEDIIRHSLPKLEVLRLKMKMTFSLGQDISQRANALIDSFQSAFWIDEHRWFVRCLVSERTIYLHTLSESYEESLPVSHRSTSLENDEHMFYQGITTIASPAFFDQPVPLSICSSKIKHLHLNLPINNRFWSHVPKLDQLKSLKLFLHANAFQSQVQALLNRATCLKRLSIHQRESTPLQTSIFTYKNMSVSEVDLRNINHYFTEEDCSKLSHSPLGRQCQKLSILVRSRESVLSLVKNMHSLRSLNVRCQQEKDDLLQWLADQLTPSCVIARDPELSCSILVWIWMYSGRMGVYR